MTPQEKKQLVKEAIIRAVPSVMDLVFGCEVRILESEMKWLVVNIKNDWLEAVSGNIMQGTKKDSIREIIGRPISLQDVLVAIGKKQKMKGVYVNSFGLFLVWGLEDKKPKVVSDVVWDLSQDFDHQSEAVWGFLWELLVNNK